MLEEIYTPGQVIAEHGVLWRLYPTDSEPDPPLRLYGGWHGSLADAVADMNATAANPRCEYAAVYTRSTTLWARTDNAIKHRGGQTMGKYSKRTTMPSWYERPLEMTIPDSVKEFREAKSPSGIIDILADLNDTQPSRIAWILQRAGCEVPAKKLPRTPRNENTPDYVALWEQSEDARICDEYKILKENNEAMNYPSNYTHASPAPVASAKPDEAPAQPTETAAETPAAEVVKNAAAKTVRSAEDIYVDALDIFWNTYLSIRLGVSLDRTDIVRLTELSDIARAAAGGAV